MWPANKIPFHSLMSGQNLYPKMRQVDVFPAEFSGQKVICLRDPLNLSGKIIFLPYPAFFIVSLFDGQNSLLDIQEKFMRQFGELLFRERIEELAIQMEEHLLLDSERFRRLEQESIKAFRDSPTRPLILSGEAYEGDPGALKKMIHSFFAPPEGPELPAAGGKSGELLGGIAPHIDYRRGGNCYAWAHKAIQESSSVDLFIILGTAHSPMGRPFALTRKNFETPWGPVSTDQEFLGAMEAECPFDLYADEFVHKTEHSIELHLIFLRSLWERDHIFHIIPVLCGSFHEAILEDKSPMEIPGVRPFIEALKKTMARSEKKICLLASADLAHVGLRFGDGDPPNRFSMESLGEEDRRMLRSAEEVDAEKFYEFIRREKDRRRICGLPPIYTFLRLLEGHTKEGKLLSYGQSLDEGTQSAVTYASMAFY